MQDHLKHHVVSISPPALIKVSKQIRKETLPMFYGGGEHVFLFTLFPGEERFDAAPKWLQSIGRANASMIRHILAVSPLKCVSEEKTFKEWLAEWVDGLGLAAKWRVLEYPLPERDVRHRFGRVTDDDYCTCETCFMPLEGEGDIEDNHSDFSEEETSLGFTIFWASRIRKALRPGAWREVR